jgi:Fe-S-cluster containining protein
MSMGVVPCNGCTECCRGPNRKLVLENYTGELKTYRKNGKVHLANKSNGDCYYLGEEGCTVYDDRPDECRSFDCRAIVKDTGFPIRVRMRGVELLHA